MTPTPIRHLLLPLLVLNALVGCTTIPSDPRGPADDNMDAVIWLQSSATYAGVTTSIYNRAESLLRDVAQSSDQRLSRLSIVMDLDETVLDNSAYQAQLIVDRTTYTSETWDQWVSLRSAGSVPGAVEFIQTALSLGFSVDFITNRSCRVRLGADDPCPQKEDTLANLRTIGIDTTKTTLALRSETPPAHCRALLTPSERSDGRWSSDKTSRRSCVQHDHEILMLFGDQIGDFTEEHETAAKDAGREIAKEHADKWGKSWFMLPNPTYGNWKPRTNPEKRELLKGIP